VVLNCESFDVLPVHGERCALEAVVLAGGQPELRRFYDGDAAGLKRMRATADVDFDAGMIGVGVLLPLEGFDVALAVLIDVIDEPSLSLGASLFPSASANCGSP